MAEHMSSFSVSRSVFNKNGRTETIADKLSLAGRLLYAAALTTLKRAQRTCSQHVLHTQNEQLYRQWRTQQLAEQLRSNFNTKLISGKNVLDFACGTGELSFLLLKNKPASIVGIDIDRAAISKANNAKLLVDENTSSQLTFLHHSDDSPSPVESDSVDLICCFDALEHINDVGSVLIEWRRMLRPGGRVWIWWSPWRGPYGHHLDSLVPLPWVHLLLSERAIFSVCAKVYDHSAFVPRKWDIDSSTGEKKPNKWRSTTSFSPFLNRMTRSTFEYEVSLAGLQIKQQITQGFSGSLASRLTRALLPIPILGDGFVSYYVYVLEKPIEDQSRKNTIMRSNKTPGLAPVNE